MEEYYPVTDKWTKKSDMPTARMGLANSVVEGKIYAIGGYSLTIGPFSTVEKYDPAMDKWVRKTDMPTKRHYLTTAALHGRIYAIGGTDGTGQIFPIVEEYNVAADTWMRKADMPVAKYGHSANMADGKIYVIGGVILAEEKQTWTSTVEEFDTDLAGKGIDPKGKLPTTWGEVRTASSR